MSSRQGFNLFHKNGRLSFFRRGVFGDCEGRKYVLRDTFGRYICKMLGHSRKTYLSDIVTVQDGWCKHNVICSRCYRDIGELWHVIKENK